MEDQMAGKQLVAVVLGLVMVFAVGIVSTAGAQGQSVTLNLVQQNNSGITGTATLTEMPGGKLRVEIKVNGAGAGPQPAHIHGGSCAQLDPAPRFSLTPVANGSSTAEIDATLAMLTAQPSAIHMHKSQEELPVYVACADIRAAAQAAQPAQPGTLPRAGDAGSLAGLAAGLSGLGASLVAAGYLVRRRARR